MNKIIIKGLISMCLGISASSFCMNNNNNNNNTLDLSKMNPVQLANYRKYEQQQAIKKQEFEEEMKKAFLEFEEFRKKFEAEENAKNPNTSTNKGPENSFNSNSDATNNN